MLFFEAGVEGLDGIWRLSFGGLVGLIRGHGLGRSEFRDNGIGALEEGGKEGVICGKCWEV